MSEQSQEIELNNAEFQNVMKLINQTNSSVYMTGRAGTGKSTFLRYIVEHTKKKTVVLAPTGIAAVNVGGVTLHSFFRAPLHPFALDDVNYTELSRLQDRQRFSKENIKLFQNLELLVIDEVSMVRADLLDFVDNVLRIYTHSKSPFGGKQLLLVGDAFQLEPVATRDDWEILRKFYKTPYFFEAAAFRKIKLVQIELRKVYRQHEHEFLTLLDRVRVGKTDKSDLNLINSRVVPDFAPENERFYITLTSRRTTADNINNRCLDAIDCEPSVFKGLIDGDFPDSLLPTDKVLTLKPGAQVVFIKNDKFNGWYNGTIARVLDIEEDKVRLMNEKGDTIFATREVWQNKRYRYNEALHKVEEEVLGSFSQFPIKLAWAITIHKSQGLTFDRVIIDISGGAFAYGQVYVALSRCRTLDGIVLRTPINTFDIKSNKSVIEYSYQANDEQLIDKQLNDAKASNLFQSALAAFRKEDYRSAVSCAAEAFALQPEHLKRPAVQRFISNKLGIIKDLQKNIEDLRNNIEHNTLQNKEFAHEYYLLAVECRHRYKDNQAAMGNINKALKLYDRDAEAWLLRAELNLEGGDYEMALSDCEAAIEIDETADAYLLCANVHIKMRNFGNAYNTLLDALRDFDDDIRLYRLMVDVCKRIGDDDEAARYKEIIRRLEQNDFLDDDDDF